MCCLYFQDFTVWSITYLDVNRRLFLLLGDNKLSGTNLYHSVTGILEPRGVVS